MLTDLLVELQDPLVVLCGQVLDLFQVAGRLCQHAHKIGAVAVLLPAGWAHEGEGEDNWLNLWSFS